LVGMSGRALAFLSLSAVITLLLLNTSDAAFCNGKPHPDAKPNLNTIFTADPVFVREVKNAKLYTVGDGDDKISVVHLWGTPYERGFAHGTIMKQDALNMVNSVWEYIVEQVESAINGTLKKFPPKVVDFLATEGLDGAFFGTYELTKKYTGNYFYEELHGLADASGADYHKILGIHMIGEVTKGSCSMFGAWGTATASTGSLLQLRALDWDVDGPFKNFPQITVYHSTNASDGNSFANVGWTGWLGSITGINDKRMAISEIGVSFPDETFGTESRIGIPFTFLLRDILQWDHTLDDSINRMANAKRTCNLILGVGDGKLPAFRSVQYSGSNIRFFDDQNMQPVYDWHPRMENVVYYGMDWLCPGYTKVLSEQLTLHHGNITAENAISDIVAYTQTGNLVVAIYDLTNNVLHVSNARGEGEGGNAYAFERAYTRIDMTKLFAVKASAV